MVMATTMKTTQMDKIANGHIEMEASALACASKGIIVAPDGIWINTA